MRREFPSQRRAQGIAQRKQESAHVYQVDDTACKTPGLAVLLCEFLINGLGGHNSAVGVGYHQHVLLLRVDQLLELVPDHLGVFHEADRWQLAHAGVQGAGGREVIGFEKIPDAAEVVGVVPGAMDEKHCRFRRCHCKFL